MKQEDIGYLMSQFIFPVLSDKSYKQILIKKVRINIKIY